MAAILRIGQQQRSRTLRGALAVAATLLWWCTATAQSSASYQIPRQSIDAGAGRSSSASYTINASIGQPDAGVPMTSASYSLRGGFQRAAPAASLPNEIFSDGFEGS
jgi:hypothetical protein